MLFGPIFLILGLNVELCLRTLTLFEKPFSPDGLT